MKKFLQNKVWIHGPDFLLEPESEWPKQLDEKCLTTEEDPEIKKMCSSDHDQHTREL